MTLLPSVGNMWPFLTQDLAHFVQSPSVSLVPYGSHPHSHPGIYFLVFLLIARNGLNASGNI